MCVRRVWGVDANRAHTPPSPSQVGRAVRAAAHATGVPYPPGTANELPRRYVARLQHPLKTVWPSGLRRWLKAPFRKGVGSNPTAVMRARSVRMGHHPSRCAVSTGRRRPVRVRWWCAPRSCVRGVRGERMPIAHAPRPPPPNLGGQRTRLPMRLVCPTRRTPPTKRRAVMSLVCSTHLRQFGRVA